MAGSEARRRRVARSRRSRGSRKLLGVIALLGAGIAAGCASSGGELAERERRDPLPPQTLAPPPAPVENPNPPPPPTPPTSTAQLAGAPVPATEPIDLTEVAPTRAGDPTLIFIDPAETEGVGEPTTLAGAAAREKARRDRQAPPVVVINNKNLAAYAEGGVLTIAAPANVDDEAEAEAEGLAVPVGPSTEEGYWRQRGLEIRRRWREAADRVPDLVAEVERLRQRFYATDDPAYRDAEIKPQWDRALAGLEEARYQAERGIEEVRAFLEEGRRAGALPGWLREGAELEPEPVIESTDPAEAGEPVIYEMPEDAPPPSR
jgi:hypothetical protein